MRPQLLLVAAAWAACAAPYPCSALSPPDYLATAQRILPGLDAAFSYKSCSPLTALTPCNGAAELASAIVALWEAAGPNATAAARASELMKWFVLSWATATHNGTAPNRDAYDFFACDPIAHAFRGLLRLPGGLAALGWSPGDAANARLAARDVCGPEMRGMWNQAMSRAVGTAVAVQAWPELDEDGSWSVYVRNVISDWTSTHGYAENSPVYNSIAWVEMLTLADEVDSAAAAADAASAPTQFMGRAWRDLMGPGGYMPAFGDAWSGAGVGAKVWGFEEPFYWPATFERLAAAAPSASEASFFAWAAASYFAFGAASANATMAPPPACAADDPSPPPPGLVSASPRGVRYLLKAHEWRVRGGTSPTPMAPPLTSHATMRRMPPAGLPVPDKLVLAAALAPGGGVPYAMAELLSTSALYHCHVAQLGALVSLVARNTTFIHGAGRDNYLGEMASTVVLWRDPARAAPFPFPDARSFVRPGEWTLLELPTANMQPVSQAPQDYFLKNVTHLHFFVRNSLVEPLNLDLAYIALVNPDTGAAIVVDDFKTVTWPSWPNGSVIADNDAPGPAGHFLRIVCAPGKSTNSRPPSSPPLSLLFDARDFPILRLFWRPSSNAPTNDTGLLVLGHGPYTVPEGDFNAATPLEGSNYDFSAGGIGDGAQYAQAKGAAPVAAAFHPSTTSELDAATVRATSSPAGDSFGAYTIRRHYSSGVTWARAHVLIAEGALVVVDTLAVAPGDHAGGWLAGPSWLLQAAEPAVRVDGTTTQAYDAGGFNYTGCFGAGARALSPERLLIALFAPQAPGGGVAGATPGALVGSVAAEAVYIHAPLVAGGPPARFVSVLLPHAADDSPAALAAAVALSRAADAVVVSVPVEGGARVNVTVGDDGESWSVAR